MIARNYAETLLALAQRQGGDAAVDEYGAAATTVAEVLRQEPRIRAFFDSPSIASEAKKQALRASFQGRVPEPFLRFLLVVVDKGRERLLGEIDAAYEALVDELRGRARAEITLAEPADATLQQEIVAWLTRRLGKTVIPRFHVDPSLLGGVVVHVEGEVLDGSVRRRLNGMRRRLLGGQLARANYEF